MGKGDSLDCDGTDGINMRESNVGVADTVRDHQEIFKMAEGIIHLPAEQRYMMARNIYADAIESGLIKGKGINKEETEEGREAYMQLSRSFVKAMQSIPADKTKGWTATSPSKKSLNTEHHFNERLKTLGLIDDSENIKDFLGEDYLANDQAVEDAARFFAANMPVKSIDSLRNDESGGYFRERINQGMRDATLNQIYNKIAEDPEGYSEKIFGQKLEGEALEAFIFVMSPNHQDKMIEGQEFTQNELRNVRKQIAPDRYRSSGNLLRDLITGSEGKHSIDQTTAAKFIAEDMMLIAPSLTGMEYTRK